MRLLPIILLLFCFQSTQAIECKPRYPREWQNVDPHSLGLSNRCIDEQNGFQVFRDVYETYMVQCENKIKEALEGDCHLADLDAEAQAMTKPGARALSAASHNRVDTLEKDVERYRKKCVATIKETLTTCQQLREQGRDYIMSSWNCDPSEREAGLEAYRSLSSSHISEFACPLVQRSYDARVDESSLEKTREEIKVQGGTITSDENI